MSSSAAKGGCKGVWEEVGGGVADQRERVESGLGEKQGEVVLDLWGWEDNTSTAGVHEGARGGGGVPQTTK